MTFTEGTSFPEKAMQFAAKKHGKQMDKSGLPYIMHPVAVASIIACIRPDDENLVAAGFLHDTLEDTETTYEELVEEFNEDIANLVKEVTKIEEQELIITFENGERQEKINKVKTFPNLHSQRGFTLKFADMTHNASRMGDQPFKWQQEWINKIKIWIPKTNLTG